MDEGGKAEGGKVKDKKKTASVQTGVFSSDLDLVIQNPPLSPATTVAATVLMSAMVQAETLDIYWIDVEGGAATRLRNRSTYRRR
jgi:hypothetical protein